VGFICVFRLFHLKRQSTLLNVSQDRPDAAFCSRRWAGEAMLERSRYLLIIAVILAMGSACGGPVSHVTVGGLRVLHVGMTMDEVVPLIGMPAGQVPGKEWGAPTGTADVVWIYDGQGVVDWFRAVRLSLEFLNGRLVYARSYRRSSETTTRGLFTLNGNGTVEEGPELTKRFSP
jgi:hypothetical protein